MEWGKFKVQISDSMDRWKSRGGKSQRREKKKEKKKKIDQRRARVRRKKLQVREKVGKSRKTMFFQWFVAPEGRKVGLLKRRVRSQLARWEMKNCTPLWRKHICKSKCAKHLSSGPLLEVEMSKKCTPLWREAHFEVTMYIAHFWKLRCSKSSCRCGSKHISKWTCLKRQHVCAAFGRWSIVCVAGARVHARDSAPCQKWAICGVL